MNYKNAILSEVTKISSKLSEISRLKKQSHLKYQIFEIFNQIMRETFSLDEDFSSFGLGHVEFLYGERPIGLPEHRPPHERRSAADMITAPVDPPLSGRRGAAAGDRSPG